MARGKKVLELQVIANLIDLKNSYVFCICYNVQIVFTVFAKKVSTYVIRNTYVAVDPIFNYPFHRSHSSLFDDDYNATENLPWWFHVEAVGLKIQMPEILGKYHFLHPEYAKKLQTPIPYA